MTHDRMKLRDAPTVAASAPFPDAAEAMSHHGAEHLSVAEDGECVGRSSTDITAQRS
ncbi:MAG: hypothetical protein V5A29_06405 [Haloarculaceae archaeon]